MVDFYRRDDATYFAFSGLPTHKRINDGTPSDAPVAGQKTTGDNNGTYYVAFGENANSAAANRPHDVLALNTDLLDDWFHRNLAVPVIKTVVNPGSAFDLSGDIFVGMPGTNDDEPSRSGLFSILTDNAGELGPPPLDESPTGLFAAVLPTAVQVTGGGASVIGTAGGFYDDPHLVLNKTLPAGTYYVLCYERLNVAEQPEGLITRLAHGEQAGNRLLELIYNNNSLYPAITGTQLSLAAVSVYDGVEDIVDFINLMLDSRANVWGGTQEFDNTTQFDEDATFTDVAIFSGGTATLAPMRITPQANTPSSPGAGDVNLLDSGQHNAQVYLDGEWRTFARRKQQRTIFIPLSLGDTQSDASFNEDWRRASNTRWESKAHDGTNLWLDFDINGIVPGGSTIKNVKAYVDVATGSGPTNGVRLTLVRKYNDGQNTSVIFTEYDDGSTGLQWIQNAAPLSQLVNSDDEEYFVELRADTTNDSLKDKLYVLKIDYEDGDYARAT